MPDYIDEVFGPGGIFARAFPGYEARPGQVDLARMVDAAMRDGTAALGEGPCGTGKGVAYCVPAIWHAHRRGQRVVIATANIALQEQLVRKDLPMLAGLLPWPVNFALLKGRNNYLCRDALLDEDTRTERMAFARGDNADQVAEIVNWSGRTEAGDVSELSFVPAPSVWSKFSVTSTDCKGGGCDFVETCFFEAAKERANEASIVVTNYHLLFAHLAVRRATDQDLVLPGFSHAILDEAHAAADIARDFFGFNFGEGAVWRLVKWAKRYASKLEGELRADAAGFFDQVDRFAASPDYGRRLRPEQAGYADPRLFLGSLGRLIDYATTISTAKDAPLDQRKRAESIARRGVELAAAVREATSLTDPNKVYYFERDAKQRIRLVAKVIDVSRLLSAELFETDPRFTDPFRESTPIESVSMVSATLTTAGNFRFVRSELGVPEDAAEVIAESPFDFRRQALFVVPGDMPGPNDPEFQAATGAALKEVIDACGGRTLGLFTSYKNLNAAAAAVTGTGHRVLRQGDLPRTELARVFKADVSSVLLGTESFWTGIDVPGEALTGLVIDKIPFEHLDDPLVDILFERDRNAFNTYLVPKAIILFRQGFGRLIRSQKDVGAVVFLDHRILSKPYGARFLRSLPKMAFSRSIGDIPRFLAARGAAAGDSSTSGK